MKYQVEIKIETVFVKEFKTEEEATKEMNKIVLGKLTDKALLKEYDKQITRVDSKIKKRRTKNA